MKIIERIYKVIISMGFMGVLLGLLAATMAVATFIESSHGATAAQGLIYQAWWFELAILFVFVNIFINIFRFKLYTLKKLPVFIFHVAFLVIILGAGLTRFTGVEGTLRIREGASGSTFQSYDNYFYLQLSRDGQTAEKLQKVYLSALTRRQVNMSLRFGHDRIRIRSVDFVKGDRMQMNSQMGGGGMHPDVLQVRFKLNKSEETLVIRGVPGTPFLPNQFEIAGIEITAGFGVKSLELPFELELRDFQLDRYPGSNSPSSFASEVTLIDEEHQVRSEYRIFMNNILKYRGYRFYQSSYDTDEKGTVLSVNHDQLGTTVTYVGYALMIIFIILALFAPGSKFQLLIRKTARKPAAAIWIAGLMLLGSSAVQAQPIKIDKTDAKAFGKLWIHGSEGRIKPVNTIAFEIIRKVTGNNNYEGYSAEQFWLSLMLDPEHWEQQALFEVKLPELKQVLRLRGDMATFGDFFINGQYALSQKVNEAYSKKPNQRNALDKAIMKVDEKVNVFYMALTGQLLTIYPDPRDSHARWLSPADTPKGFPVQDSLVVKGTFTGFLEALSKGNRTEAATFIRGIGDYQLKHGSDVLPVTSRASLEMVYNKWLVFERLAIIYAILGMVFLVIQFMAMFRLKDWHRPAGTVLIVLTWAAFALHTAGLGIRWYISGHAPMSNGYESMIFVAWGTILAGILVARRSRMSVALTLVLAALSLLVAHMSWMNPEITPLVPVLKSVWLTIHVAVIMTSYSFLGLGALIGLVNMVLFALKTKKNHVMVDGHIEHLTNLNKVVLIVGLYLITIGCFLGAIWANESWGRYWGWDPKETWCLVTILVYTFVTHMQNIKGFGTAYSFNLGSLIGLGSVLMTYFGVNYFLGGMHSYAGGEAPQMPILAYVILIVLVLLTYVAYFNQLRFEDKKEERGL